MGYSSSSGSVDQSRLSYQISAEVILTARNRDKLEEVKKNVVKAHIFDHDLSKLESIDDLVNELLVRLAQ